MAMTNAHKEQADALTKWVDEEIRKAEEKFNSLPPEEQRRCMWGVVLGALSPIRGVIEGEK